MEYFRDEKGRLVTQKQYERALNRLSPVRRLLNKINYDFNMKYTESKIWHALEKRLPVCYIEYRKIKPNEVKDVVARLEYLGYTVNSVYISYGTELTASFWVQF